MTSYRANGGGDTIIEGAGIPREETEARIVARYPEIREMVYQFIKEHGTIDPVLIGDRSVIGEWHFVPEKVVAPKMAADMGLLF
jgi:2',3'-cyclic-nucleotide 2'-phosphodiesterase/3'-nucleotidase